MRISTLAKRVGVPPQTIRFYERSGLLPRAARAANNYRSYGPGHEARLRFIRRCRAVGLNLSEVRVLAGYVDRPRASCAEVNRLIQRHLASVRRQMAELHTLERQLAGLRRRCRAVRQARDCGILQELRERSGPKTAEDTGSLFV